MIVGEEMWGRVYLSLASYPPALREIFREALGNLPLDEWVRLEWHVEPGEPVRFEGRICKPDPDEMQMLPQRPTFVIDDITSEGAPWPGPMGLNPMEQGR